MAPMNHRYLTGCMVLLTVLIVFILAACAQNQTLQETPPPESYSESEAEDAAAESEFEPPPEIETDTEPSYDAAAEEFISEDIYFKKSSAVLQPEAREILQRKARWLLDNPEAKIVIQGHSDEPGSKEANFALGDRRAGSVISYLIELGIDLARMTAVSYGKEKPVSMGTDEASRAKNRRVHIEFDIY